MQKVTLQIDLILRLKGVKKVIKSVWWTYVINNVNGKEIAWTFYKNECQKTS